MDIREWAKIQQALLKSKLKTIRQFWKEGEESLAKPAARSKSQMSIAFDILLSAKRPLHAAEIIQIASEMFHVNLDRESLVSAMAKKVKSGRMFKRIAPNMIETPFQRLGVSDLAIFLTVGAMHIT